MMTLNLLWPTPRPLTRAEATPLAQCIREQDYSSVEEREATMRALGFDLCPSCNTEAGPGHDLEACERYEASVELERASFILEAASGHLAKDQPVRLEDWDQDTREANRILNNAWMQLQRDQVRIGTVSPA